LRVSFVIPLNNRRGNQLVTPKAPDQIPFGFPLPMRHRISRGLLLRAVIGSALSGISALLAQQAVTNPLAPTPSPAEAQAAVIAAAAAARPAPPDDPALTVVPLKKTYNAKPGETDCVFSYDVTNTSNEEVIIKDVVTSCGCSVPKLPSKPWKLPPGGSGNFQILVDLRGKSGSLIKTATVDTLKGQKSLMLIINIPAPAPVSTDPEMRARNMQLAANDRQAVFKGDCIRCHVTPTMGQMGQPLYAAACGVCHEAEHRGSMVPDLHKIAHATSRDYWKSMIVAGKPGTLMPAFSMDMGGPLNRAQIDSLTDYLVQTFPSQPTVPAATPAKTAAPTH
jgi:cytochrome c553